MSELGFIGTGAMGCPMAFNLLASGHRLYVHDIDSNNVGGAGGGGVTAYAGSAVNHNSIGDNLGYGLGVPVMAGFTNNTFSNNGPGIDVLVLGGGPHPTAGFFNLCSGIPGPSPTCP